MKKGGSSEEQRTLRRQFAGIKRWDRAARLAEEDEVAARFETIEALVESGSADGIVNHVHALAAGDLFHLREKIRLRVENKLIRAGLARELGLGFRGHRADHSGAAHFGKLNQQESHASRCGMNERN